MFAKKKTRRPGLRKKIAYTRIALANLHDWQLSKLFPGELSARHIKKLMDAIENARLAKTSSTDWKKLDDSIDFLKLVQLSHNILVEFCIKASRSAVRAGDCTREEAQQRIERSKAFKNFLGQLLEQIEIIKKREHN